MTSNIKIKILYIIVIFLLFLLPCTSLENNSKQLIKRNLLIIPFFNQYKVEKYNYIIDMINNNLKRKLEASFTLVEDNSVNLDFNNLAEYSRFIDPKNIEEMTIKVKADSILYGDFIMADDNKILFHAQAYDALIGRNILSKNFKIDPGYDLQRYVNEFVQLIGDNLTEKFTQYDINIINKITEKDKKKEALIENLISQAGSFWNISVKIDADNKIIQIPFLKNVVIFVCTDCDSYSVETEGQKTESKSQIIYFSGEDQKGKPREFKISFENKKSINYKYIQRTDYEVNIKYFKSENEKKLFSFFIDNSILLTTSGYIGYNINIGLGLPQKSKLDNNLLFGIFIGPKPVNYVETKKGYKFDNPHLKLKFTLGYEHIFMLPEKIFPSFHLGINCGVELYFFSFLISGKERYELNRMVLAYPSLFYSIPFSLTFFSIKNIELILGFEPVLRFVINAVFYENKLWLESVDETRDALMKPLRRQINDYLTLDLFFYDMPVYFYIRLKI